MAVDWIVGVVLIFGALVFLALSRTILIIFFRVSKTPLPTVAEASKVGQPHLFNFELISSTGKTPGRSLLLN